MKFRHAVQDHTNWRRESGKLIESIAVSNSGHEAHAAITRFRARAENLAQRELVKHLQSGAVTAVALDEVLMLLNDEAADLDQQDLQATRELDS